MSVEFGLFGSITIKKGAYKRILLRITHLCQTKQRLHVLELRIILHLMTKKVRFQLKWGFAIDCNAKHKCCIVYMLSSAKLLEWLILECRYSHLGNPYKHINNYIEWKNSSRTFTQHVL